MCYSWRPITQPNTRTSLRPGSACPVVPVHLQGSKVILRGTSWQVRARTHVAPTFAPVKVASTFAPVKNLLHITLHTAYILIFRCPCPHIDRPNRARNQIVPSPCASINENWSVSFYQAGSWVRNTLARAKMDLLLASVVTLPRSVCDLRIPS